MTEIHKLYPRLVVSDGAAAIEFYRRAFGAREVARFTNPAGKIVHAEISIGNFTVAVKDEGDGDLAATSVGGTPVSLTLDVADADAVGEAMTRAGGTVIYPINDQPYGQRGGRLADPFGHQWMITQQIEDLTPAEIQQRTTAMYEA